MSTLKRLDVPPEFSNYEWLLEPGEDREALNIILIDDGYASCYAHIGRDGFYYDRKSKFAWVEYKGMGWCKKGMVQQFKWELDQLNTPWLNAEEEGAILTVIRSRALPCRRRELSDLLSRHQHNKQRQQVERDTLLWVRKTLL